MFIDARAEVVLTVDRIRWLATSGLMNETEICVNVKWWGETTQGVYLW